ncbi:MAG TPA: hypothetical protein VMZ91_02720 [Candidatus Paceibacterota bacterium]|nr:hypothetical protein [Candidatus Paceibacterota bacterium]
MINKLLKKIDKGLMDFGNKKFTLIEAILGCTFIFGVISFVVLLTGISYFYFGIAFLTYFIYFQIKDYSQRKNKLKNGGTKH